MKASSLILQPSPHPTRTRHTQTLHKPVVESAPDAHTEMISSPESGWVGTPSSYRKISYSKTANVHITNIQDIPVIEKPPTFSVPPLSLVQERLDRAQEEVRLQRSRGLAPQMAKGYSKEFREAALARGVCV